MEINISGLISALGTDYADVNLEAIQAEIRKLSDTQLEQEFKKSPHDYMIRRLAASNEITPEGLHFHWDNNGALIPEEVEGEDPPIRRVVFGMSPTGPAELLEVEFDSARVLRSPCGYCGLCIIIRF